MLKSPTRTFRFSESQQKCAVAAASSPHGWRDDRHPPKMIILDMDSSVSPTHGDQEGTAYNGHFGYHPHRNVLEPVVMRYKERKVRLYFRGDAAFASPEIYEYLEAEGLLYVIRLKANAILQRNIAHLLTRPVAMCRFHASSLSGRIVEQEAPCRGQSGVAPRRAGSRTLSRRVFA